MSVLPAHVHVCTSRGSGTVEGQKKALDPLELELQASVSHHVGAGTQTCVLRKGSKGS